MMMALNLLCRVIRRRAEKGENLESVLMDYPKLTEGEREQIGKALGV